jgi:uncharacterized protein
MVDTLVPDYVDAKKIFAQHALISGILPISRFSRFCELLADNSGNLHVTLQFHLDDSHRRIIDGEIDALVSVTCQRCLEPAKIGLTETFKLGIVETESHIARLPADIDPWMVTEPKLVIADFLEEQLILAMPIVSYHSEGCKAALPTEIGSNSNRDEGMAKNSDLGPFAILQKLKEPR